MDSENLVRRLRGAMGNAVAWGVAWSAGFFVLAGVLTLAGAHITWEDAWQNAARGGVMGGIVGGAFSLAIGFWYRGRRLADISWRRFGLGGGVVAGLFVPFFIAFMRAVSGDPPMSLVDLAKQGLLSAAFGGVAAGASMLLAQRAEADDPPAQLGGGDPLGAHLREHTRERVDR